MEGVGRRWTPCLWTLLARNLVQAPPSNQAGLAPLLLPHLGTWAAGHSRKPSRALEAAGVQRARLSAA